jgi:hypothetical protein
VSPPSPGKGAPSGLLAGFFFLLRLGAGTRAGPVRPGLDGLDGLAVVGEPSALPLSLYG